MLRKFILEIFLVLVFGIGVVYFLKQHSILSKRYIELQKQYDIERTNNIIIKRNSDSTLTALVKTQIMSKETAEILFKTELEKFKQETNKSIKDLKSITSAGIVTNNKFEYTSIEGCDSLNLNLSDKFTSIAINVKDGVAVVDSQHKVYLTKYTYKTRNKAPWYQPWKWGKHVVTQLKSDNPKDSILELKEIIIEK